MLVQAHHGSIARAQRIEIEDNLKSGRLPALVATSSLELGIDMGAIDLVIQIEAPPSIASGMQRIGRASHQVGDDQRRDHLPEVPRRSARLRRGHRRHASRRDRADALSAQSARRARAAARGHDRRRAVARRRAVRRSSASAAPFAELARTSFDGVLDMLSGLYPSDEFAELRPRVTWDRVTNILTPRPGAKRIAITSGGTIPDRGLFGVFLAGAREDAERARRRAR